MLESGCCVAGYCCIVCILQVENGVSCSIHLLTNPDSVWALLAEQYQNTIKLGCCFTLIMKLLQNFPFVTKSHGIWQNSLFPKREQLKLKLMIYYCHIMNYNMMSLLIRAVSWHLSEFTILTNLLTRTKWSKDKDLKSKDMDYKLVPGDKDFPQGQQHWFTAKKYLLICISDISKYAIIHCNLMHGGSNWIYGPCDHMWSPWQFLRTLWSKDKDKDLWSEGKNL